MASADRRERERDELRSRIVDAARDLFAAEGYEAVSMRRIAEAIEYSPTAIYGHFQNKADLFREVCGRDFAALAGAFTEEARSPDPVERLRATGRAYVRFAVDHPNHYRLMFMTPNLHRPDGTPEPLTAEEAAVRGNPDADSYAFLRDTAAEAVAAGRFRPGLGGDAELIAQTLWAGVHGVASLQIAKADDPWIDMAPLAARTAAMIDGLLDGLLADAPPKSKPATARRKRPASWKKVVKR